MLLVARVASGLQKSRVLGCWRGYLSVARCRPSADATGTHCLSVSTFLLPTQSHSTAGVVVVAAINTKPQAVTSDESSERRLTVPARADHQLGGVNSLVAV